MTTSRIGFATAKQVRYLDALSKRKGYRNEIHMLSEWEPQLASQPGMLSARKASWLIDRLNEIEDAPPADPTLRSAAQFDRIVELLRAKDYRQQVSETHGPEVAADLNTVGAAVNFYLNTLGLAEVPQVGSAASRSDHRRLFATEAAKVIADLEASAS